MSSVVVTAKEKFLLLNEDRVVYFMGSMCRNADYVNLWKVFE